MADVSKLKRRSLGAPPSIEEASPNLQAPESAPALTSVAVPVPFHRMDGRSARRTNRTLAFATRVSPEFDNRLREIAERDDLKLVEVLERSLEAYESFKSANR